MNAFLAFCLGVAFLSMLAGIFWGLWIILRGHMRDLPRFDRRTYSDLATEMVIYSEEELMRPVNPYSEAVQANLGVKIHDIPYDAGCSEESIAACMTELDRILGEHLARTREDTL